MMLDYNINNNFCKARNINGNLYQLVMDHLCELINDDQYQVIAVIFLVDRYRQPCNKVHGEIFPTVHQDKK